MYVMVLSQGTRALYSCKILNDIPWCPCLSLVVLEGICIRAKTISPCGFKSNSFINVGKHESRKICF